MQNGNLFDAVYGCLIGGAIGDALGAPVEGWNWEKIRSTYGKVTEFRDYDAGYARGAGCVTDDSYLRHLLCLTIAEKSGRVIPDDFAKVLKEKMNPERLWLTEQIVFRKLKRGMNPWWETGRGNIPAGVATMAIAPVGIINAGNPAQAYQDGFCIGSINQDGNNRDCAATFAAGVAAAFAPDASEDTVIETMLRYSDTLTWRALRMSMDLAAECRDADEYTERFYESPLMDWTWPWGIAREEYDYKQHMSGSSIEFLPVVTALLRLCRGKPEQAVIAGASFGRDCDTIASCVGSVMGALHGASAFPERWIEQSELANRPIFEEVSGSPEQNFHQMAQRLLGALHGEHERISDQAQRLSALLA